MENNRELHLTQDLFNLLQLTRKKRMSDNTEKEEEKPVVAKTAVDLQRLKLVKLMKNIDKPIVLPERPKAKGTPSVPEFVRNVMGSSAGAGSGEFHVYRHLRRKEYARQKFIQEKAHKELLDIEYHEKLEQNKKLAEETTAKKRAKRLKRKQGRKQRKKTKTTKDNITVDEKHSEDDSSDEDEMTRAAESTEINKESDEENVLSCLKNIESTEDKTKTSEERSSSLVNENQQEVSPVASPEISNENSQCENGT